MARYSVSVADHASLYVPHVVYGEALDTHVKCVRKYSPLFTCACEFCQCGCQTGAGKLQMTIHTTFAELLTVPEMAVIGAVVPSLVTGKPAVQPATVAHSTAQRRRPASVVGDVGVNIVPSPCHTIVPAFRFVTVLL